MFNPTRQRSILVIHTPPILDGKTVTNVISGNHAQAHLETRTKRVDHQPSSGIYPLEACPDADFGHYARNIGYPLPVAI